MNDNIYPDWDAFFLGIACVVSARSKDQSTKHGAVIVDNNHHIIGVGYNGFVSGISDEAVPQTRPEKYKYVIHAEENALLNCAQSPRNCTLYITGKPCGKCIQLAIQAGIRKIIHGQQNSNMQLYDSDEIISQIVRDKSDRFEICEKKIDLTWILNICQTPQAKMLGEFNIQDVVDRCKKEKNIEGYVGYFNDEELIKIKTPWYLELHKALNITKLSLARKYQIVFSDEIYDIIALLNSIHADASSELKKIFDEAYKKLWAKISELIQAMEKISIDKSLPKKEFNSEFARLAKESGFEPISAMFAARDDKDFVPILQQYIIANLKEKS